MKQKITKEHTKAPASIIEGYDCKEHCRTCPFPGGKCFQSKYSTKKQSKKEDYS